MAVTPSAIEVSSARLPLVRLVPLAGLIAVLWTYIGSSYAFRAWYVAAALALVTSAALIAVRALRTGGLSTAAVPVVAYFAILLAGMLWAEFPAATLEWVAMDAIGIVIFTLAFVAGRNAAPGEITSALITLWMPSVAMAAVMHAFSPAVNRPAPYAVAMLPFVLPFAVLRACDGSPRRPALAAITAGFAVLVFGNSRTQLAVACVLTILAALAFRRSVRDAARELVLYACLSIAAVGVLAIVPTTRPRIASMFARTADVGVAWGSVEAPREGKNLDRASIEAVSRALLPHALPLGIGYGNFPHHFKRTMGHGRPIHNTYMVWLLEGGVFCVVAVLVLAWRHLRNLGAMADTQRDYGRALAISSLGVLGIGVFHQVHQTPAPWLLLGLAAASSACARRPDAPDDTPRSRALLDRWRRADPPFAPALCEPLMAAAFRHLSASAAGSAFADIGCGSGLLLPLLRDAGYRVVGIDADPSAVAHAPDLPVICGAGERLPLASSSVDALFVFSAFQYMDRTAALEECRRVLKPGGRFVVVENLEGNPVAKLSRLVRRLRGAPYSTFMEPRQHLRWEDRAVYARTFSSVAFEAHHILTPLFLLSEAVAQPRPAPSPGSTLVMASFRVLQRWERRILEGGWLHGVAWHLVAYGRK